METKDCKIHGNLPFDSKHFTLNKGYYYCKQCKNDYAKKYAKKARENLEDSYLKTKLQQRVLFNLKESLSKVNMDKNALEVEKLSILSYRTLKYSFEENKFSKIRDLAKYVEQKYGVKHRTVEWRLRHGYSLQEITCTKRKEFKVKKVRYCINNIKFCTLKEICKHYSLKYCILVNNLYKEKTLEEVINYLVCKKNQ